jgi:hypothetical protein
MANEQVLEGIKHLNEKLDKQSEEVVKALDERDSRKESLTIVISRATQTRVKKILTNVGFTIQVDNIEVFTQGQLFSPFLWNGMSETDGTRHARDHLENELTKFGARFSRGYFKLVDCHENNNLLSFDDPKIGKISGGSDLIIVPFKTASESYSQQVSVLFELKTNDNVRTFGLQHFVPQGHCELLAARVLSYQPKVLAIVTDLFNEAVVFQINYDKQYKSFNVVETFCSLSEMATLVSSFLSETAIPNVAYRPLESNPKDEEVLIFKKTKVSNDDGIAMEHLKEIMDDPESSFEERYHFARQLFMSSDIERMPTMLNSSWQSIYS